MSSFEEFDLCSLLLRILPVAVAAVAAWVVFKTNVAAAEIRNVDGKHVVITGGSSGIGKAVAVQVVQRGANCTIIARNEQKLKEAVEEIQKQKMHPSQKVEYLSLDITGPYDEVSRVLQSSLSSSTLGPVYMLVNCAGTAVAKRFEDTEEKDFKRLMDINYFGSVNVTKAILPQMKSSDTPDGVIVFVSSQAGLIGLYGFTAYTASKYAVRGFAESLQMELKPYGIGVTVNFPPDTDTPGLAEENKGKPEETTIISETAGLFKPEQVAKALISDALKGNFWSSPGLDGWMLTTVSAAMTESSPEKLITQVALMGPLRLIGWGYRIYFNRVVKKCKEKREAGKRKQ